MDGGKAKLVCEFKKAILHNYILSLISLKEVVITYSIILGARNSSLQSLTMNLTTRV